jgi:thiosulfate dehydrogenase (quinone) large subunit
MPETGTEGKIVFLMRLCLGWVFLYAASHQVFVAGWSVSGFLEHTKTFHWLFAPMAGPSTAPILSFFVEYGHLLIGLSLVFGLMVRLSSFFGILLMLLYWMAHMDFPYIGNHLNFIVDEHIVYALVLGLLIVKRAGHVYGLDAWAEKLPLFSGRGLLHWTVA